MQKIKIMITICLLSLLSITPVMVHANEYEKNEDLNTQEDFSDLEEKGLRFEYINEDEFNLYIPSMLVNEEEMKIIMEQQANPNMRVDGWAIVSIAGTVCWLVSLPFEDFDPCSYIVQESIKLMSTGKPGLNGKYKVSYTYVPGCEPIHSGPCNSGYYKASYSKV